MAGTVLAVLGVLLAAGGGAGVSVGLDVHVDDATAREVLVSSLRTSIEAGWSHTRIEVVEGCDDVEFCLAVVGAPVSMGGREKGIALASHVSRRLVVHPQWPFEAPPKAGAGSGTVTIEDAATASGNGACIDCESALEAIQRKVDLLREITAATMVDEGDLQVAVGPQEPSFFQATGAGLAAGLLTRHLEVWWGQRQAAGGPGLSSPR